MAKITFYTKPACKNAKKQVELLEKAGHSVNLVDLLAYAWNESKLKYYFANKPASYWFNPKHPNIKSGEINPEDYSEEQTIKMLLEDPLYIRRPILEVDKEFQIGFDADKIDAWIGLQPVKKADAPLFEQDVTTCKEVKC